MSDSVELFKSSLKFETGGEPITIDVIDAYDTLHGRADKRESAIVPHVKEWFRVDYEIELTGTQALTVAISINSAYESLKKKLSDTLGLPEHFWQPLAQSAQTLTDFSTDSSSQPRQQSSLSTGPSPNRLQRTG